jgi:hypothetical protein
MTQARDLPAGLGMTPADDPARFFKLTYCWFFKNYKINRLPNYKLKRIHGQYSRVEQRRTQESQTRRPQEDKSGKAEEAARLRARVEEAQGEEAGSRTIEAVAA